MQSMEQMLNFSNFQLISFPECSNLWLTPCKTWKLSLLGGGSWSGSTPTLKVTGKEDKEKKKQKALAWSMAALLSESVPIFPKQEWLASRRERLSCRSQVHTTAAPKESDVVSTPALSKASGKYTGSFPSAVLYRAVPTTKPWVSSAWLLPHFCPDLLWHPRYFVMKSVSYTKKHGGGDL